MNSSKVKKGLGRGLSSLIGESKVETQKNELSISDLIPNKYQPRKIFDEENLNDLTKSIKESGFYSSGTPFMKNTEWKKNAVGFKRLYKLLKN